ncbi:Ubiquitin carboxyl-terminal hydrolase [Mycena indigotica]|uniref:Ubiquitin carboxyl-terminal hydrolase n=1 Tax=Mycena indigotica TaxID=2126181 RepID=A0A8H6S4T4_9AGAR|nr:Ubiquitin carboxyl-terminal hydrolase [Mycena indigotica]KAF7292768.1 Ubiquitin carboxyl-terminal hydrolase [Mycena indigotica]
MLDPLEEVRLMLPQPVHALILIYSTTEEYEKSIRDARQAERNAGNGYSGSGDGEPVIWFDQTIRHACGFMSLLHASANLSSSGDEFIERGSLLANLLRDALPLAPVERAALLKSSQGIADVYNTASVRGTSTILHAEDNVPGHYVCFVRSPRTGHIFELDGGKNGPIDQDGWLQGDRDMLSGGLKLAKEFIANRTDPKHPHCHVMALVPTD